VRVLPHEGFHGLRVLTLESRRAAEISRLIEKYHGKPLSMPAMREVPLAENSGALGFARELIAGGFDIVIFHTGAGARALLKVVEAEQPLEPILEAMRRARVVARGPKPLGVLRGWNVLVLLTAPEPCTWRELVSTLVEVPGGIQGQRVVVQEYGVSNAEFPAALKERGAVVKTFAVYQWALPLDTLPLRDGVNALIDRQVDIALFTTGVQATHLFQIVAATGQAENLRYVIADIFVASIGPTTSETLHSFGILVDLEPSHQKMGVLVKETAERSGELTGQNRPCRSPRGEFIRVMQAEAELFHLRRAKLCGTACGSGPLFSACPGHGASHDEQARSRDPWRRAECAQSRPDHFLLRPRGVRDQKARRSLAQAAGGQLRNQRRKIVSRHVKHHGGVLRHACVPVPPHFFRAGVIADKDQLLCRISLRQRNLRSCRGCGRRRDSRNNLELNSSLPQRANLFMGPPEDQGIPAFQAHHGLPAACRTDHSPVNFLLRSPFLPAPFTHAVHGSTRWYARQNFGRYQVVVQDQIRLLQHFHRPQGQQLRGTWSRASKVNLSGQRVASCHLNLPSSQSRLAFAGCTHLPKFSSQASKN
jgi:uroporphyrinogen-III synthase